MLAVILKNSLKKKHDLSIKITLKAFVKFKMTNYKLIKPKNGI